MNKLWIFGDSFSIVHSDDSNLNQWPVKLASSLNLEIMNCSIWGSCQDWVFAYIEAVQEKISRDDQIVISLPDPARFWFYIDHPSVTGAHVQHYDKIIQDTGRVNAIESYIRYIQRPQLDTHFMTMRLGYLNNISKEKQWKKPIVIKGGAMELPSLDNFNNLIFSNGSLREIDFKETKKPFVLNSIDVRYNHLSLRNHKVLVDKIVNTIENNETRINLLEGFHSNFITYDSMNDETFVSKEFSPWLLNKYKNEK